jgi:hypothetical protein
LSAAHVTIRHNVRPARRHAKLPQYLGYDLKFVTIGVKDLLDSQYVLLPLRQKQAISKANTIVEILEHAFPAVYIRSMTYKDERVDAAFSSSLLLLSTTSPSRLMALLPINHFSNRFVPLAHVPSPLSRL